MVQEQKPKPKALDYASKNSIKQISKKRKVFVGVLAAMVGGLLGDLVLSGAKKSVVDEIKWRAEKQAQPIRDGYYKSVEEFRKQFPQTWRDNPQVITLQKNAIDKLNPIFIRAGDKISTVTGLHEKARIPALALAAAFSFIGGVKATNNRFLQQEVFLRKRRRGFIINPVQGKRLLTKPNQHPMQRRIQHKGR